MPGVGETVLLRVRQGEVADRGSWVYVWCRVSDDEGVVYVGATGLDPATRAWLHLHDADPAVGRVLALLPSAREEPLDIVALRLPQELPRAEVKTAVIASLARHELLSAHYVGEAPDAADATSTFEVSAQADELTRKVAEHLGRPLA